MFELREGEFVVSDDPARLDLGLVHSFLRRAYWSEDIPREVLERGLRHSLCFGVYEGSRQVGFGRAITDRATYAYVADVFVIESHRGRGLAKLFMRALMGHPELQGLRRWALVTGDAHELYRQFGFTALTHPERHMEIHHPDIYKGPRRETMS